MAKCITCGTYFKLSAYNQSNECNECVTYSALEEDDVSVEIGLLTNPTGRTPARIQDENDADIDSFSS
jgi:hypothetical protein